MNSQIFSKVNANTVFSQYLNITISIIAPDLIFVHNGTFTTSVILCCTNTFGRLVYYHGINQLHFIKPSMSNENGAHAIECSLTIDESLSTKSFLNKNQIPISIRMI